MTRFRLPRAALVITLAATLLPLIAAGQGASAPRGSSGERGLLGTEAGGTGRLPNFTAKGANLIRLLAGAFDPLSDPLPSPQGIPLVDENTLPAGVAQYWLVQVRDKQFPQANDAVTSAGGLVVGYIHDDTYMVRATPDQRAVIDGSQAVRWSGYYQPAWRVPVGIGGDPGLVDLEGPRTYRVYVFSEEPNPAAVGQALGSMTGVEVVDDAGVVVDVRATKTQLPAIAALPAVEWIALKPKAVLLNANARWVNDTGIRDLYSATAPGRLTGAGQTAAVADSGLNYTYDLNDRAHVAFRDCDAAGVCKEAIYTQEQPGSASMDDVVNHNTGHRKMVAYFDIGDAGPNPFDRSSHGSHTAGSVDGDQPPYDQYTGEDGLAVAAEHVHQNLGTTDGGLVIPLDLYDLFRQAYRPRNPASVSETSGSDGNPSDYAPEGTAACPANTQCYRPLQDARAHNNSWGVALAPLVDPTFAARMDEFVWDHEDMAIVFSAGNAGPGPLTIISPSVGKNDMSSGASANGRQPMVSIDSMARFSSHGPTGDQRFGPDLATPGQIVVSVKGGTEEAYHTAQGTSMSGPVLTGLATLVRQYFFDGYAAGGGDGFAAGSPASSRSHNPSAALVKAALVNGAERMRGYYTGDDGTDRNEDGQWPSAGQGFGRVNLANSLYFGGDPSNNWYVDVYRGDTTGDQNLRAFTASALPQTRTFQLNVDAGQPLDVTLAWTDAPDLAPGGTPALVNDLNLVVTGPGGTTYAGNNMNSRANPSVDEETTIPGAGNPDTRNPTERVRVANPTPGTYTVTVQAPPIAPINANQGFALAASGDIAPVSGSFSPGPQLQVNQAGTPTISNVRVTPISSNTAKVRFQTNEPTTATADTSPAIAGETFVDSYNEGFDGFAGDLGEGPVETSAEYADKPVVGTQHEMLLTGFSPGQSYTIQLQVRDLANNLATRNATLIAPATAFQPKSDDTGQCWSDEADCQWDSESGATQLYAGEDAGAFALGAFMFRTEGIDPADITMATVEMVSAHNWVIPYTEDPVLYVDLLPETLEPNWGTQDYETIHNARQDARAYPETTHKRGAYQKYAFTFSCEGLDKLKQTLANGNAAFRWDSSNGGLFSMDFGYNRRSRGPDLRPRLVLYTNDTGTNPTGEPCDPAAPAPTITNVGIHEGLTSNSVTVSWETLNVESDSVVLFREQGTTAWTQVGTPARTKVHHVQVFGLSASKDYEFVVRSAACNGASTTDTNGGAGYDFFPPPPPDPGPRTEHASYTFETGAEGWAVTTTTSPVPPDSTWVRGAPGASGTSNGWHVAIEGNPSNKGYSDEDETMLTSPAVAFAGAQVGIEFQLARDTEPGFDFVHVEHSANGTDWTRVASFDGTNADYPLYEPRDVRFTHPNPGGSLQIRFRFVSDQLLSSPGWLGASVDEVKFASYPNAEERREGEPLTGPVPPPSAGASGLSAPPTRVGEPTPEDRAAGTGYCFIDGPDLTPTAITRGTAPTRGRRTTLTATVANVGGDGATNVVVRFLHNGQQIGTDKTIAEIPPGASRKASVTWRPTRAGPHTIQVVVDPNNTIEEVDEGNNTRERTFTVRRPRGGGERDD